jgi:uncharacterized protein with HEPN domain
MLSPKIPWDLIAGFRHVIGHGHNTVRVDRVQRVLDEELAPLLEELEILIRVIVERGRSPLAEG